MQTSNMSEDIKVTFIIPKDLRSQNECPEEMQLAFVACEQHSGGGLHAKWIHESSWTQFEGLTKRNVFVLQKFEGELYEKLHATKCLLVGPRCLSCCLTEGTPIPSGPEPVFTVAMRGLVITASGLSKQQKENIKKKVHWMGGIYNSVLTDDTTHLVSDTVISDKYIKSIEKGIPVMSEAWIEAVWEASLHLNVNGSSADFDIHLLPPFANLQVTTSGITKRDKQMIMKLVNEGGGVFSGAFQSETTDIVVLTKEGIGSEKYKAALEYGKACVLPTWVKDSANCGYALPLAKYKVAGASTSSPLAESRLPDMSLNFSRITNLRPPSNFVDESRATDVSTMSGKNKLSQEAKKSVDSSIDKEILAEFENLDMSTIKKAGPIFDGFSIWVCGLEGVARERAVACVSRAGGVRYDAPHPCVTHVVCGGMSTGRAAMAARAALPAAPVLSPLWLLRSVQAGKALAEHEFLLDAKPATPSKSSVRTPRIEPASPMSKRNLQLLRRGPLLLPPPEPEVNQPDDELVNHYLSQKMPEEPLKEKTPEPVGVSDLTKTHEQPDITDDADEPTEEIEQIFRGIKIEVQGLDEEAICEIGAEVSAAGGVVCAAGAGGSYALVPLDFDDAELITKGAEAVTVFWVKDCLCQQELVPIQYYHRPVRLAPWGAAPLAGVVASLSTYSGVERAFLDELAKLLGATTQLRFCRRNTATSSASTHLICPSAGGDKYLGAVKWGLPAVQAAWLLECAAAGKRVSETEYLVGETKAPLLPQAEEIQEEEAEQTNVTTDKENAMLPPVNSVVPRRGSIPSRDGTPKAKDGDGEMSPASRYIAMARQGLLGGDSQETPERHDKDEGKQECENAVRTPSIDDALSTPNLAALSPATRRRLQAVRRGEMPSDPIRTPQDPFAAEPSTPDSAFGCALRPGSARLSPDARKRLWKFVDHLPTKQADPVRDKHTPLSEIRNRFLAQFNGDAATPPSEHTVAPRKLLLQDQADTPPAKMPKLNQHQSPTTMRTPEPNPNPTVETSSNSSVPAVVDAQLQRLNAALAGRLSSQKNRRQRDSVTQPPAERYAPGPESQAGPESQPNTVGWDDTTPAPAPQANETEVATQTTVKRFMLSSNVDNREEIIEMIIHMGGEVCEGTELDPEATHLLCAAPGRSEKMLGSVAAGRWVLHPAYVARSRATGGFLPEEEYEWGNPIATCLPAVTGAERVLARAAHRWRKDRGTRGPGGLGGPFAGVVALLHIPPPRRRLLSRLVVAGGGVAPDDDNPIATCLPAVTGAERILARAAHRWRKDRGTRGPGGLGGPFAGVVALLHIPPPRRRLLSRLVVAGGGVAPDDEPPYTNESITVCFADIKRYPLSERDAAWLVSRRIPVCAPVLLSSYLTDEPPPKPEEHCLPDFRPT